MVHHDSLPCAIAPCGGAIAQDKKKKSTAVPELVEGLPKAPMPLCKRELIVVYNAALPASAGRAAHQDEWRPTMYSDLRYRRWRTGAALLFLAPALCFCAGLGPLLYRTYQAAEYPGATMVADQNVTHY